MNLSTIPTPGIAATIDYLPVDNDLIEYRIHNRFSGLEATFPEDFCLDCMFFEGHSFKLAAHRTREYLKFDRPFNRSDWAFLGGVVLVAAALIGLML